MAKSKPGKRFNLSTITVEAARRIQSHADRTGTNQKFKARAMRAAAKNAAADSSSSDKAAN